MRFYTIQAKGYRKLTEGDVVEFEVTRGGQRAEGRERDGAGARGTVNQPAGTSASLAAWRSRSRMPCVPFCVPRRARIQVSARQNAFGAKRKPADLAGFSG